MPTRIKPSYDLGMCVLNRDSVRNICALVDQHFGYSCYGADDGLWELYEATSFELLSEIASRRKLDQLYIKAEKQKQ